ncbi:hypothetical protein PQR08_29595, partial [Caballeronia jiangsuensis]
QRVSDNPGFAASLPKRHAIHTMLGEQPDLMESDYLKAREKFAVASFIVVDAGDVCTTQCTFANSTNRIDILPAYITMNLCGALKASIYMSGLITVTPAGSA